MNFAAARRNMVECQLRTNKVIDEAALDAFATVPREQFVTPGLRAVAYVDEDLPIGRQRFLMEPMVLARLVQLVEVQRTDIVLDLACGTGYSTAILSKLAASVVAVEGEADWVGRARELLAGLGVDNAVVHEGDPAQGWSQQAPYDAIVINGAIEILPPAVGQQLAEGGRMAYVQRRDGIGRAMLMTKSGGILSGRVVFEAAVPPLPGFRAPAEFVF